ncbi:LysR family transcriptional regulator [Ruegeria atlantica]|uniref:LysR family transcriptional regulator n=1 Tax=Ruegeria atlantica TaxID=81569 RepID=UPI0024940FEF|nr:LysR family transcriptional regulator [Ruegeria atlantica]
MDKIDGMRAFVAVVETGSFIAAGKRLGISNKLVSKYIGVLEGQLEVTLLHRTTRSLSLTNEGRTYLEGCRKVLSECDALDLTMDQSGGFSGSLRVTAPLTFGETFVVDAAIKFMTTYPDVTVEIDMSDRHADLAEGAFDLAIRMGPLKDSSLIAQKLASSEYLAVASSSYIEEFGSPAHPDDLKSHSCIRDTNNPHPNRWPFFIEGQMIQVPVSGPYIANSPPACLAPAYAGKGIYHCPEVFLGDDLVSGKLVRVLEGFQSRKIDVHAVYLPTAYRNRKVVAFIETLRADLSHHL